MNKEAIYLEPGEKLSEEIKTLIKLAGKEKNFPSYVKKIGEIFGLDKLPPETEEAKWHMAGFIEGEASINVSAKKLETAAFGLLVDPEFSITQHVNGVNQLYRALQIFKTGKIHYKSGSNATLVFTIDNRQSLLEKVVPFFKKYCNGLSTPSKVERFHNFKKLLELLENKAHSKLDSFLGDILPIWDKMRKQKGQVNESFASLEDAKKYVHKFISEKKNEII